MLVFFNNGKPEDKLKKIQKSKYCTHILFTNIVSEKILTHEMKWENNIKLINTNRKK